MNTPKGFTEKYGAVPQSIVADLGILYKEKRQDFSNYYMNNQLSFKNACESFQNIISLLTVNIQNGRPKILGRIKQKDECLRKFEVKYRNEAEKSGVNYSISSFITDLIGVRIVCLYEDDVHEVFNIIKDHFDVTSITDKTRMLEEDFDKFGYKGLHVDVKLKEDRAALPEYASFKDMACEIQIRSIVQDAWSEIDHRLKYKKSIPDQLKRRILRLAALFELSDQEFSAIRDDTKKLISAAEDGNIDEQTRMQLSDDRKIDSFSFISTMKKHFSNYNFENEPESESARKIDGFVQEIRSMNPYLTHAEFQAAMAQKISLIRRFVTIKRDAGRSMNPFTVVRHILYWHDPNHFEDCLWPSQMTEFNDWLVTADKGWNPPTK